MIDVIARLADVPRCVAEQIDADDLIPLVEALARHLCATVIAADILAAVLDEYDEPDLRALQDVLDMAGIMARELEGACR